MNMICFQVMGNDQTVAMAGQAGQFELNVMLPVMLRSVLESTDMFGNFLPNFTANLIDGIGSDPARLRESMGKSPVIVTLLAPKIGYLKSAELFKESANTGRTIRELVLEKGVMSEAKVDSLLGG